VPYTQQALVGAMMAARAEPDATGTAPVTFAGLAAKTAPAWK
jgi:hypothetical protein